MVKQMDRQLLGVSVSQIPLIINTIFALVFASGSVSWMYYADRFTGVSVPRVLGGAWHHFATVAVESFASGNHDEGITRLMDWGCVFVSRWRC